MRRVAAVSVALALLLGACSTTTAEDPGRPSTPASPTPLASPGATPTATAARTPAARPVARPDACARNRAAKAVLVRIRAQHLYLCRRGATVYDAPVTTGIPGEDTHTPTGTYAVQAPQRDTTLTLIDGTTYAVRYWIPFDAPLFGFHDSSWQRFPYGSPRYRTDGSHGCVHVPLRAIAKLYRWAPVGTPVRIRA